MNNDDDNDAAAAAAGDDVVCFRSLVMLGLFGRLVSAVAAAVFPW